MQDVYLSFPAGGSRRFQKCVCIQEHIIFLQKKSKFMGLRDQDSDDKDKID